MNIQVIDPLESRRQRLRALDLMLMRQHHTHALLLVFMPDNMWMISATAR